MHQQKAREDIDLSLGKKERGHASKGSSIPQAFLQLLPFTRWSFKHWGLGSEQETPPHKTYILEEASEQEIDSVSELNSILERELRN